jgi:recombination protein RecA
MSASPVFSSAALSRPFLFPAPAEGPLLQRLEALRKLPARVTPASCLEVRPAPEMVSSGIRELDALTGGFPRGCLTEICGPASSGRTSILLAALAGTTQRGEVCALVDGSDVLDPASAAAAEVEMGRLLWIRCREKNSPRRHGVTEEVIPCREGASRFFSVSPCLRGEERSTAESQLEQVLKVTDLLLQSNGFGMIALDLGDIPVRSARRIPLASWFRFRRAVEHTPTVLLVLEQQPIAGSCSSLLLQVSGVRSQVSGEKLSALGSPLAASHLGHTELLDEFQIEVELLRSRLERKPAQSVTTSFCSRAAWRDEIPRGTTQLPARS